MKHLSATFEIENDLQEYQLRNALESMNAKYIKTLADTEHLKEDTSFKELVKAKKDVQLKIDRYINDNRECN